MPIIITEATPNDVEDLIRLTLLVYQGNYPLAFGTDRRVMARLMESSDSMWLIARDTDRGLLAASTLFELDRQLKIGRVEAVMVHPEYRHRNLAKKLVHIGCGELLGDENDINSLYTTSRTLSIAPQRVFLSNGFFPLGIFPNAHRLKEFETLTFMARFKPGVIARRKIPRLIPDKLEPIFRIVNEQFCCSENFEVVPQEKQKVLGEELEFEFIYASDFVRKRFLETFRDPKDRMYPFHVPNLLIASKGGDVEIYAHFSRTDGYLALVALNVPFRQLEGRLRPLFNQLRKFGVSYIEIIMDVSNIESIQSLLNAQFLPSAFYPAMLETDGENRDFVLMTRTMEPLDFHGMEIDGRFAPFVNQYVALWKKMHIGVLKVLDGYSGDKKSGDTRHEMDELLWKGLPVA